MIEQVKDLKDTFESIRTQVERGKEPVEDLSKMKNFLIALVAEPKLLHESVDKDFRKFFYQDLTSGLFKRFTRERSKNPEYLDVLAAIFENIMLVFLNEIKGGYFNRDFFDSMRGLFEYDNILHNFNYQIPEDDLKKLRIVNQDWRKALQAGDLVDAIIDDGTRYSGWSQARIVQIIDETLHIEFLMDTKSTDRFLDRWSVELAQYQTKTKDIFEWKSNLKPGDLVDASDKNMWIRAHIMNIKDQQIAPDKTIKVAYVAFRVYMENGSKTDEGGKFEGWSNRFDEWLPLYSSRIQPLFSKTLKSQQDDIGDLDETIDDVVQPEAGMNRVYAVPRVRKCISQLFLHLINLFGSRGGYEAILNIFENQALTGEGNNEQFDLAIMADLMQCVSTPYVIYHKEFIREYGPKFIEVSKKRLIEAPEKSLRDVRREKIEQVVRSVDLLQRRLKVKEEREKETEVLKLDVALMCLKSSFLERRIQGIKDLNQIIRNSRMVSNQSFTTKFLIDWLYSNNVFSILFDPKNTHIQIVQRCSDVLRLLLIDDRMDQNILEMFWNLAKSENKIEIYKIINDVGFYLKQPQMSYLFDQIKLIPAEKMGIEEFQCLSELGKYSREPEFKTQVSQHFWEIICNDSQYKDELVNNSINRYAEMAKQQTLSNKINLFEQLAENLAQCKASIPSLKLFKLLIKDEKENEQFSRYINNSPSKLNQKQNEAEQNLNEQENTANLNTALATLIKEQKLIDKILQNLRSYCKKVSQHNQELSQNHSSHNNDSPSKKIYIVSSKYSHQEEIDERLQFIKYLAIVCQAYSISKAELGAIYELLVSQSSIPQDQQEFLTWCKSSCEQSTNENQILDLNEVGQFFTEKMQSGELDLKNLPLVGFEFLQHYFLSVNERESNLIKQQPKLQAPTKQKMTSMSFQYGTYNGQYGPMPKMLNLKQMNNTNEDTQNKTPVFKLLKLPSGLSQLDIVWNIALQCQNPKVVPKAIDFLIKVYTQLDEDLNESKIETQDQLIQRCMEILANSRDLVTIIRMIEIVKNIIYEAEKKGTGDVQPHGAILKGELLEKIQIKNKVSHQRNVILISIYSNSTIWQFKKEVAKQLDLAPKYLKLEISKGNENREIKDVENGMTLGDLGLKGGDLVVASKVYVNEEVADAPLRGPDGKLSEKANQIFNEWFDAYSDENGQMTKATCALFIQGCTGEHPNVNDERIQSMFKAYDVNSDGKIERKEFLHFYETASKNKPETVRENLRAHNIRNDLKKLSEIQEEISFSNKEMPRYKMSTNQDYFDLLISLLDRDDKASDASWDLIQMLATNQELYKNVLQFKTSIDQNTNKIDWNQFFDSKSVYKLLYTLQIIEAVMEEGEGEDLEKVVRGDQERQTAKKKADTKPSDQPQSQQQSVDQDNHLEQRGKSTKKPKNNDVQLQELSINKRSSVQIIDEQVDKHLKSEWTLTFLEQKGFEHILKVLMEKDINLQSQSKKFQTFELKHVAFLLKVIRIILMAAFSLSTEEDIQSLAQLVRRSSSQDGYQSQITDEQSAHGVDSSRFKELQHQLQGELGSSIISNINYNTLQSKILKIVAQVLEKPELTFEDKLIIENALNLWVSCLLYKKSLINEFYQFHGEDGSQIRNCDDLILHGILFCSQEKVKVEFKEALSLICNKILDSSVTAKLPLIYLLNLLSENFQLITSYRCDQYFGLFCSLIDNYFMLRHLSGEGQGLGHDDFNPENLLGLIIDKIKFFNDLQLQREDKNSINSLKDSENINNSEQENIYIGLIQLTGKIIDNFDITFSERIIEQKSLIDEIFVRFLFAQIFNQEQANSAEALKIQPKKNMRESNEKQFGKRSKDAAYKLLNSLIRKSPVLMNAFLEKSLIPLMQLIKKHDGWGYNPPDPTERYQKYVGLRNLGNICYMNSMLQQFFMVPQFRYNLLSIDDKLPDDLVDYKGWKVDDNVLHQLQKLMAHLELSERQDFNPFEFCFAFKDFDGNPTNIGEQKDAQEFLNLAFDRIENLLRDTSRKYLLQSVFGGKTCSQLLCSECGKVKNRIEDFYNMSVTVKDIKSLHESLQKLVEGEVINDYECDGCKKKVDISKRTLISQTPNVFIFHLQRIVFNFDTFQNSKINTLFEFPQQLDLRPYSFQEIMKKENRSKKKKTLEDGEEEDANHQEEEDNQWPEDEDCFEYKLVGVNVHSGTANGGHYWSYINTRRGLDEPEEDDPAWQQSENDPWMEYNDSIVSDYNFEKMKDDCFGGDNKAGGASLGSWDLSGTTYGKSAYMLVYERKKKRPLKILVSHDEAKKRLESEQGKNNQNEILHDIKKDEYYKLVDYRESVLDIAPNKIYKQVYEDNTKFSFENSVYSHDFFEFIKSTLGAVANLDSYAKQRQYENAMSHVRNNALTIGKKITLDILAKTYYNHDIKQVVENLIEIMRKDDSLCVRFMQESSSEDNYNYIFQILLECTDVTTRLNVAILIKYILNRLKIIEKNRLYEVEHVDYQYKDENTQQIVNATRTQPVALSVRFITKGLDLLNTYVAQNCNRFDQFLEILHSFGVGIIDNTLHQEVNQEQKSQEENEQELGLEFFFKHNFIEKACDFMLGKKSPLLAPGEKRYEMGGYAYRPNFGPIIRLVTRMITHEKLSAKYPLDEQEKKMLLHQDLLNVMLGSSQGSKQFGQCLANMCRDNEKLSKKVSKVFIKIINNSLYDNVKNYLVALKPFLKLQDSLKERKLEWVLGYSQIIARRGYREERYKYGLELVDKINDDAYTYISPLASGPVEDALLSQLLKCKGKVEIFAMNCLKEMISLMAKDEQIARYVYRSAPASYQTAHYSDWIRPYLEHQKADMERNNYYNSYKSKQDIVNKSLSLLEIYEQKCQQFKQEELEQLQNARQQGLIDDIAQDWLAFQNEEVIQHYPPQLIIGKQVTQESQFLVYDEDPNVTVTIYEVTNEYNYSNPTGIFNLSIPHVEFRNNNYQTISYHQYKRFQDHQLKKEEVLKPVQVNHSDEEDDEFTPHVETFDTSETSPITMTDPQEQSHVQDSLQTQPEPLYQTRNWFENHKMAPVILKVCVTNKLKQKLSAYISFKGSQTTNINLPVSFFKDVFIDSDTKCVGHLVKINPAEPWGHITVSVISKAKQIQNQVPNITTSGFTRIINYTTCMGCNKQNEAGQMWCDACGDSLQESNDSDIYYTSGS